MDKPPELLKNFADRLARVASSSDGAQTMRMLRQAGLFASPDFTSPEMSEPRHAWKAPGRSSAAGQANDHVGIWERKTEGGETNFVRRKEMVKDWSFWANVGRIEPRKARKRVVLIGESVARGFLYDPQFTPAMALEKILNLHLGDGEIEVIDLARTNLSFEVQELALSALLLEPDMTILFCGNNWDPGPPSRLEMPALDTVLREQGIPGLKRLGEAKLAARVTGLVDEIASVYRERKVPLLWIVPEFNLEDWRDPLTNAPYLTEGLNQQWIALREAAEKAFVEGELGLTADLASRMVGIDQGTCVTPLYLLAECGRQKGDVEATRRYQEMARDAVIWDTSKNSAPRTYSLTANTLREQTRKHSHALVDLPAIFHEHLDGGIPDRRLFVDYCHLSAEGIHVAMSAAASAVLQTLHGKRVPWRELLAPSVLPSREVEGEAAFLAAIHNAHWWQPGDLIQHYCRTALSSSRSVNKLMLSYLDLQNRRAPMLMCEAAERIAGVGSPLMQHYLLRFNYQRLDETLLNAIASALQETGLDVQEQLARLRIEEHSVAQRRVNLLDYYYCSEGHQQEAMWVVPHLNDYLNHKINHYFKAFNHESRFVFVGEAARGVKLSLTCRLPGQTIECCTVQIKVNGQPIGELQSSREWNTWDITIPGSLVKDGVNEIVLRWPIPAFPGLTPLNRVVDDLAERLYPEFYCPFGEIHSFVATDAVADLNPAGRVSFKQELTEVQ